jgi:predicted ribonuclease YlaK
MPIKPEPALPQIDQSPKVPQRDKLKGELKLTPLNWTEKQQKFLALARDKNTRIIFVKGPAGTSKTLLCIYAALELLNQKKISDIMYIRAAVESANSKMGFLPGTVDDKIAFYGIPLQDKLEELLLKKDRDILFKEERVKVMPVNYTRGQSWNARCAVIDEAQNLTKEELITLLTRIGKFTRCYVCADPTQSDINGKSGAFEKMFNWFKGRETAAPNGVFHFEFGKEDIMRDDLIKFLVAEFEQMFLSHSSQNSGH